jgi:hypothetical protein
MQQCVPHEDVAREFWQPKQPWKCWEFMCAEFDVVNEEPIPGKAAVERYRAKFQADIRLAQRLWPIRLGAGA